MPAKPKLLLAENTITGTVLLSVICFFSVAAAIACVKNGATISLQEKRVLAPFPQIHSRRDLQSFPTQFALFFDDRFPGRLRAIELWNLLAYKIFHSSTSPDCALGQNGWLFYAIEKLPAAQMNLEPFAANKLEAWARMLQARRDAMASHNIKYLFVIAPEKGTIYPELMPTGWKRQSGESRLDQLQKYLHEHSDVEFVDAKLVLLTNKQKGELLYHPNDSHWNEYGAFLVTQAIFNRLSHDFPVIHQYADSEYSLTRDKHRGDLAELIGLGDQLTDEQSAKLQFKHEPPAHLKTNANLPIMDGGIVEGDARGIAWEGTDSKLPRAFIMHDSFMDHMMPFLSQRFRFSEYQLIRQMDPKELFAEKPDLVIDEIAERHLYDREPENVPAFVKPNTDADDTLTQKADALTTFGGKFELRDVGIIPTDSGWTVKLLWRSKDKEKLDYTVAVHALNAAREEAGNEDYRQDCFKREVSASTEWIDTVPIQIKSGLHPTQLGIMVYSKPSAILPCASKNADWQIRLRIPLQTAIDEQHKFARACVADSQRNSSF